MIVEIFTLCDFAQDHQGKLFINGTFDTIWVNQFPSIHPNISLVLKIRFAQSEIGKHSLQIKVTHSDGKEDFVNGDLNIAAPATGVNYSTFQQVVNITNYEIKKAGKVAFELYVDEEFVEGITLGVIEAPKQRA